VSVQHNEHDAYKSYRVMAGRVRMHIRDWSGEAPPVVFLHGISGNGLTALRFPGLFGDVLRARRDSAGAKQEGSQLLGARGR